MNINTFLALTIVGIISQAAQAMQQTSRTAITPATLPAFVATHQLPSQYHEATDRFLDDKGEIVQRWATDQLPTHDVLGYELPNDLEGNRAVVDANKRAAVRQGVANKANLNLVANISDQAVVRISSQVYRGNNRKIQRGQQRMQLSSIAETNAHAASHPTYQTASMAVIASDLNDIIEREGLDKVSVKRAWPVVYKKEGGRLVRITNPSEVSDSNMIVVQEVFSGTNPTSLRGNPQRLASMDDATFQQWLRLIHLGGLWNSVDKMHINDEGRLELASVQQPDNSNPDDFYHQNKRKVEWNTTVGFVEGQIADLCVDQQDRRKLTMAREYVRDHVAPHMEHCGTYLAQEMDKKTIS